MGNRARSDDDFHPIYFSDYDFFLEAASAVGHIHPARAHGLWTYETRQGRKAATVVCSASAVVTLALSIPVKLQIGTRC